MLLQWSEEPYTVQLKFIFLPGCCGANKAAKNQCWEKHAPSRGFWLYMRSGWFCQVQLCPLLSKTDTTFNIKVVSSFLQNKHQISFLEGWSAVLVNTLLPLKFLSPDVIGCQVTAGQPHRVFPLLGLCIFLLRAFRS